jgi:PAS domain S-box-containing protein
MSLYLIPVMLGMFGILFARGIDHPVWRGMALILSVAGPLLATGYVMAGLRNKGFERILMVGGVALLMLGALVTAAGLSAAMPDEYPASRQIIELSHWIGIASLLLGIIAILSSIVRTDEAIEEIGARFRHLADHMGEGFILASADGTIALVNQRFLELSGLTRREVLGSNLRDVAQRLDSEIFLPQINERMQGHPSEYRVSWLVDGEERHFLISAKPIFNRRGRMAGYLATVCDITEHQNLAKRLERYTHGLQKLVEDRTQKLRQSEEQFRDLLLHMNEGFLTVDGDFCIRFANERICEVLQARPPALLGRDVFELVDVPGRGRLLELFENARAHIEEQMQQELAFVREDGTRIPVMVAVAPVQGGDDADKERTEPEARYSMVVTDISELKRMQHQLEMRANELQAANEELKMLDRAKDGFLSNVTHELKTPLATVRGYVEMFKAGNLGTLSPTQASALGVMERNVHRLGLLIDEMIEFSRMQIRGIELTLSLFPIRALIQECISSAKPQAAPRNIGFEVEIDERAGLVWADRKRMAQIITILLSNAVKFSHPAGKITVSVHRRPDNGLALSVEDRGIGIPAAYQQRIFDKFFQIDSSHTRRYEGTGIGLSIAKNLAEAHNGTIELVSEPGVGSTFTVVLPHALFDSRYEPPAEARLDGLRGIVADDDEESRRAITAVLERAGCRVVAVRSGYECVRTAREAPPNFIVLSEMMSDLSGVATFRKLQEEVGLDETQILLLTTPGELTREAGPQTPHFLLKPLPAEELLAQVRQACFQEAPTQPVPVPGNGRSARQSILVVDADPDFLAWLETGLARRRVECYAAADVNKAVGLAARCRPGVILVDLDSADTSPKEMLGVLRASESTKNVPIYVITGLPLEYYEDLGIAGTLRKPFAIGEVVDIVQGPGVQVQ